MAVALSAGWTVGALLLLLTGRNDLWAIGLPLAVAAGLALSPWVKAYRVIMVSAVLGLYGTFLCLEVVIRLRTFGPEALLTPSRFSPRVSPAGFVRPAAIPDLIYELVPGHRGEYMGRRVQINAVGCRSPEVATRPQPGVRRIMVFGSSIAFGAGVEQAKTYTAIAARRMSDQGYKVEAVNCGVPAAVPATAFARARTMAAQLSPTDVVIEIAPSWLQDTGSTEATRRAFGPGAQSEPPVSHVEQYSFALAGFYPAALLRQRFTGFIHRMPKATAAPVNQNTRFIRAQIEQLASMGRKQGFAVVAFLIRGMSGVAATASETRARDEVAAFGSKIGVTVKDTWSLFGTGDFGDDFIVFPGDLHPNARAHERFGMALAEALMAK